MKDLDLASVERYSRELAKRMEHSGYVPGHVLYVERAGLFIGSVIAEYFGCPMTGIRAQRSGGAFKERVKLLLRYLPRFATHFLRRVEIKSNVHGVNGERNVHFEGEKPPLGGKILVVDDAIDTGHSVRSIMDFLSTNGYVKDNIKVAVLTTTHPQAVIAPDFSCFEQVVCTYPWSYDSREYNAAWQQYDALKAGKGKTGPGESVEARGNF